LDDSQTRNYNKGMDFDKIAPEILSDAWGCLEVAGQQAPFKDAKLYPGGARAWDWNETGTQHSPGIQPADIEELVQHGAEVIVLSRGRLGRLAVSAEALRYLQKQGVDVEVLRTPEAIRRYNALRLERPTGALIHSTC
jgi:hypothetical protein